MKSYELYKCLFEHFGPQNWWPGDTPVEIVIGAILTQNTSWINVEKAIQKLKEEKALSINAIIKMEQEKLASLIRSSGYYNQKAERLKLLFQELLRDFGALENLKNFPAKDARLWLLNRKGVGPETADSILLYALEKPYFVIDTYTMRIASRIPIAPDNISKDYHMLQKYIMNELPDDIVVYNEYHALFVALGKDFCNPRPKCLLCPVNELCSFEGSNAEKT